MRRHLVTSVHATAAAGATPSRFVQLSQLTQNDLNMIHDFMDREVLRMQLEYIIIAVLVIAEGNIQESCIPSSHPDSRSRSETQRQ